MPRRVPAGLHAVVGALLVSALVSGCTTRFDALTHGASTLGPFDGPPRYCPGLTTDSDEEGTRTLLWARDPSGRCRCAAERLVFAPNDVSARAVGSLAQGPIVALLNGFGALRATVDPALYVSAPPGDSSREEAAGLVRILDRSLLDASGTATDVHGWFEGPLLARVVVERAFRGEPVFGSWERTVWQRDLVSGTSPLVDAVAALFAADRDARLARAAESPPVDVFDRARRVLDHLSWRAAERRLLDVRASQVESSLAAEVARLLPKSNLASLLERPSDPVVPPGGVDVVGRFRTRWLDADAAGKVALVASLRSAPAEWGVAGAEVCAAVARELGEVVAVEFEPVSAGFEARGLAARSAGTRTALGRSFGDAALLAKSRTQWLALAKSLLVPVELYDEPSRVLAGRPERSATHPDLWVGGVEWFTGPFPRDAVPGPRVTLRLTRPAIVKHVEEWVATDGTNARARTVTKARLISTATLEGLGEKHERKFELAIDDSRDTAEGIERSMNALFAGRVAEFIQEVRRKFITKRLDAHLAAVKGVTDEERAVERAWLRRVFADDLDPALATLRGEFGAVAEP